ncbi:matrixin family metalloprotease [Actinomycetes bacterium KLBMP 9797]
MRLLTSITRGALAGTLVAGVLAVAAAPASAFCTNGFTTWRDPSVARVLGVPTTFPTAMRSGLEGGISQWNRSQSVLHYNPPDYVVSWPHFKFRGEHRYSSIMGSAPGYALREAIVGNTHDFGHLFLSDRFTWVNGNQDILGGKADTRTIVVHEMGHFTGLNHPDPTVCLDGTPYTEAETFSVMTTINTGTRRFLTTDDIAGVQSLY